MPPPLVNSLASKTVTGQVLVLHMSDFGVAFIHEWARSIPLPALRAEGGLFIVCDCCQFILQEDYLHVNRELAAHLPCKVHVCDVSNPVTFPDATFEPPDIFQHAFSL